MKFKANTVKGKGRGKRIGVPTINLTIPKNFALEEGIYASWVMVGGKKYMGALHFGPIPTFDESDKSLEVFLIDAAVPGLAINNEVEVEIKEKVRDILKFDTSEELVQKIGEDVKKIRQILTG